MSSSSSSYDSVFLTIDQVCAEIDACRRLLADVENSKNINDRLVNLTAKLSTRSAKTNALSLETTAMQCEKIDLTTARNIWLACADYNYYIVKDMPTAAYALERCATLHSDIRKRVTLLELATRIYEKAKQFEDAIRIERALETFDLAVNWIANSRRRQAALAEMRRMKR